MLIVILVYEYFQPDHGPAAKYVGVGGVAIKLDPEPGKRGVALSAGCSDTRPDMAEARVPDMWTECWPHKLSSSLHTDAVQLLIKYIMH